jgi:hypothetical protein
MDSFEHFSQSRMDRCAAIQYAIVDQWQRTNNFQYIVRATEPIASLPLCELRKQYFSVGVGSTVQDIPFHDMLTVFSLIIQQQHALKNRPRPHGPEFTIKYQISTNFPDDEAVSLLKQIQIQTPHDKGTMFQVEAIPQSDQPPETL